MNSRILVASMLSASLVAASAPPAASAAPASVMVIAAQAAPPAGYQGRALVGKTNVDRAIGKCAGALVLGALLGAGIGAAAGDAGKGAAIGAGVGAVACVVLLKIASDRDKRQIRAAQLEALNAAPGAPRAQTAVWTSEKGAEVRTDVTASAPGSVLLSQAGSLQCRADDQCKVGDSWYPKATILAGQVDANAARPVRAAFTDARELVCRRTVTKVQIDDASPSSSQDVSCLVGDRWVTGDQLKKLKIDESHIRA